MFSNAPAPEATRWQFPIPRAVTLVVVTIPWYSAILGRRHCACNVSVTPGNVGVLVYPKKPNAEAVEVAETPPHLAPSVRTDAGVRYGMVLTLPGGAVAPEGRPQAPLRWPLLFA